MKREQVSVWAVYVRREAVTTVLVKTRDPEEARRIALENATDWTTNVHAVAYPHQGRIDQPVWSGDLAQYPQQPIFKGEQ